MVGVLNTRPREQASGLSAMLRQAGYRPYDVPLVELALLPKGLALLTEQPTPADGFLLSSPSLLTWLSNRIEPAVKIKLAERPWYLVSAAARTQVEALGGSVAFAPKQASLQGLLAEFPHQPGLRLLHLCSSETRLNPEDFARLGVEVQNLPVYSPRCPDKASQDLENCWAEIRAVLFASGSAVRNLFQAAPALGRKLALPVGPYPISIGPSATDALRDYGVENPRQAPTADNAGLLAALEAAIPPSIA